MTDVTSAAGGNADDMVLFPIPRRWYPAVVQYVGDLSRAEGAGGSTPEVQLLKEEGSDDDPHREWTREDVRQLKSMVHNPTILAVFDIAKEQGGAFISIRTLEEHTGRKYGQVRADLAGLTRMCRTRLNHENWPFAAVWAADGKPQMSYKISDEVLRWWQED